MAWRVKVRIENRCQSIFQHLLDDTVSNCRDAQKPDSTSCLWGFYPSDRAGADNFCPAIQPRADPDSLSGSKRSHSGSACLFRPHLSLSTPSRTLCTVVASPTTGHTNCSKPASFLACCAPRRSKKSLSWLPYFITGPSSSLAQWQSTHTVYYYPHCTTAFNSRIISDTTMLASPNDQAARVPITTNHSIITVPKYASPLRNSPHF